MYYIYLDITFKSEIEKLYLYKKSINASMLDKTILIHYFFENIFNFIFQVMISNSNQQNQKQSLL